MCVHKSMHYVPRWPQNRQIDKNTYTDIYTEIHIITRYEWVD